MEVRAAGRNAVGSVGSECAGPTRESWRQSEGGLERGKIRTVRPRVRENGCRAG